MTTLFLPIGYGSGTIIYDKENKPWEATKATIHPIYEVVEVSEVYAEIRKKAGAQVLISTK
jgi:hypothetical protein